MIWDISDISSIMEAPMLVHTSEFGEIDQVQWSTKQKEWIAYISGSFLHVLKVGLCS